MCNILCSWSSGTVPQELGHHHAVVARVVVGKHLWQPQFQATEVGGRKREREEEEGRGRGRRKSHCTGLSQLLENSHIIQKPYSASFFAPSPPHVQASTHTTHPGFYTHHTSLRCLRTHHTSLHCLHTHHTSRPPHTLHAASTHTTRPYAASTHTTRPYAASAHTTRPYTASRRPWSMTKPV